MLKKVLKYCLFGTLVILANSLLRYDIGNLGYLSVNLLLIYLFAAYFESGLFALMLALAGFIAVLFYPINLVGYVSIIITVVIGLLYSVLLKKIANKNLLMLITAVLFLFLMTGKDVAFFGLAIISVSMKYHFFETLISFLSALLADYVLEKMK
ncbi:MAG: hypothetical protein ACI4WG_04995 [Erysipelotrichaceae bacterium]